MILVWLAGQLMRFGVWLVGLVPVPAIPSSFMDALAAAAPITAHAREFAPIFPGPLVLTAITVFVAFQVYAVSVRVIRWLQSTFTGGGGSVA